MPSEELLDNEKNWRLHPYAQTQAIGESLERVGIAAALIAYHSERNGGKLTLIDGHARRGHQAEWPTLILDVNDEEADLLLLTLDPMTGMADSDPEALLALIAQIGGTGTPALEDLLLQLARDAGEAAAEAGSVAAAQSAGPPEMELQPFEHYDYLIVLFRSSLDWGQAKERLGLKKEAFTLRDGATRKIGYADVPAGPRAVEQAGWVLEQRVGVERSCTLDKCLVPFALEVDDVDGQPRLEVGRVDLQPRAGETPQPLSRGRDDEAHRPRLAPERLREREAGLPEREVERRGLERPPPVAPHDVVLRRTLEEVGHVEPRPEIGKRLHPDEEFGARRRRKQVGVLEGDLLAATLVPRAAQADERGAADATARRRTHDASDLDGLYGKRQPRATVEHPARARAGEDVDHELAVERLREGVVDRPLVPLFRLLAEVRPPGSVQLDRRAAHPDREADPTVPRHLKANLLGGAGAAPASANSRASSWRCQMYLSHACNVMGRLPPAISCRARRSCCARRISQR